MAEPSKFHPQAHIEETPEEELKRLLQTLHDSGALRLFNSLVGRFPDVAEVLARELNSGPGRNLSGNLSTFAAISSVFPAARVHALLLGIADGLGSASGPTGDPPGVFAIVRRLAKRDARRGLAVIVSILEAMGRRMADTEHHHQLKAHEGR